MDKIALRKKTVSAAVACIAAYAAFAVAGAVFLPRIEMKENALRNERASLERLRRNLSQKGLHEERWSEHQKLFQEGAESESVVNDWVKSILAYASGTGLVFERLEPQTVRSGGERRRVRLYVAFEGDAGVFAGFIRYLQEQDPLSEVESFTFRSDARPGKFRFEAVLGKVLP